MGHESAIHWCWRKLTWKLLAALQARTLAADPWINLRCKHPHSWRTWRTWTGRYGYKWESSERPLHQLLSTSEKLHINEQPLYICVASILIISLGEQHSQFLRSVSGPMPYKMCQIFLMWDGGMSGRHCARVPPSSIPEVLVQIEWSLPSLLIAICRQKFV